MVIARFANNARHRWQPSEQFTYDPRFAVEKMLAVLWLVLLVS